MFPALDVDGHAFRAVYGGAGGTWGPAMEVITVLGGGWSVLALAPMVWHTRTRRFAAALTLAIVAQAVLVWSLKLAVGRVRPWIAFGLPEPIGAPRDPSFPSGHAAGSFCVAAFLAMALPVIGPGSRWLSRTIVVGCGGVAALVAISRVYLGAHFPSDVVAGALIGALVGAVTAAHYAAPAR
ncbi:MAG TPA: phosphatase PAP2 family protein [Polyangiaceae bacterium]|nr:phosphatase PAP2 family protein [Polyangiaceae bacterium]